MKATINGIIVEGTPQEIMEYQRLQSEMKERKDVIPHHGPWWGMYPPDTKVPRITGEGTANTPDWMRYPTIVTCNHTDTTSYYYDSDVY